MIGDAAGLIAPLSGNGMAMAIRSSRLAANLVLRFYDGRMTRAQLERAYRQAWQQSFQQQLRVGRLLQHALSRLTLSNGALGVLHRLPAVTHRLIRLTHGDMMATMPPAAQEHEHPSSRSM